MWLWCLLNFLFVCLKAGGLVPDDLMVRLVLNEVAAGQFENNLLLDGFPRTLVGGGVKLF
jgi:adenylate kinase family enzyme